MDYIRKRRRSLACEECKGKKPERLRKSRRSTSYRKKHSRRKRSKKSRSPSHSRKQSSKRTGKSIFFLPSHVYLASSDRIDLVHSNGQRLKSLHLSHVETYVTVVGGFSGLNYLLDFEPQRKIIFFDVNPYSVQYSKLIVELVKISTTPEEFIGRVFNRSVINFMEENQEELTYRNQETYLARKFEPLILVETMMKLSLEAKESYRTYLLPFLHSHIIPSRKANCARLLPCWEYGKYVPVSAGGSHRRDWDGNGAAKLVPNTNTFHYGEGWLQSLETYRRTKRLLETCEVSFLPMDILSDEIHCALEKDFGTHVVMHISNIDDFFVHKWNKRMKSLKSEAIKQGGSLTVISATNGVRHFSPTREVNLKAYDF